MKHDCFCDITFSGAQREYNHRELDVVRELICCVCIRREIGVESVARAICWGVVSFAQASYHGGRG